MERLLPVRLEYVKDHSARAPEFPDGDRIGFVSVQQLKTTALTKVNNYPGDEKLIYDFRLLILAGFFPVVVRCAPRLEHKEPQKEIKV
jgi:hypothetical protein